MKENKDISTPMIGTGREDIEEEIEELTEWDKKSCGGKCFHYMFCLFCCVTYEKTKKSFQKTWKKYLQKEGKDTLDRPFQILTNLYANSENSLKELGSIRLNPNLVSQNQLRNDLEFYIPQLCTFLLFGSGDFESNEGFYYFLLKVCNTSFFFAHRVHWFLSAMLNNDQENIENIRHMLYMVNSIFKTENKQKKKKN